MELKIDVINTAKEYIPNLKKGIANTLNLLREDKIAEGSGLLVQVIEGLDWVIEIMVATEDVHKHKLDVMNIKESIKEMIEALQNKDYILVSDILEYEIMTKVEEWENILVSL